MSLKTPLLARRDRSKSLRAAIAFHRFRLAFKYSDDQPRDELGRWVETEEVNEQSSTSTLLAAARGRAGLEKECKQQYDRDVFQCKMVGLSSCYAQAMVRLIACERGNPIPPLNY